MLALVEQALDALGELLGADAQDRRRALQQVFVVAHAFEAGGPGERLDAAHVGGDGALGHDLDRADHAQGAHVRAAAQLHRSRARFDHPDHVAVLVAEEGDRSHLLGFVLRRLVGAHRLVGEHPSVRQGLDLGQLFASDGLVMAEVEAQAVGRHERSLLLDVGSEHLPEGPVQEMGAGVVAADGLSSFGVDPRQRLLPRLHLAVDHSAGVAYELSGDRIRRVGHAERAGVGADLAGVADLAA